MLPDLLARLLPAVGRTGYAILADKFKPARKKR
jgi:hypothetical protein